MPDLSKVISAVYCPVCGMQYPTSPVRLFCVTCPLQHLTVVYTTIYRGDLNG